MSESSVRFMLFNRNQIEHGDIDELSQAGGKINNRTA